nr:NAD(P)H-dependent oxidoreductase [Rhizomicrobium palustre]
MKKLVIINGHPDPRSQRFCAGLAQAYQQGAEEAGWRVTRVELGALPLTSIADLAENRCSADIQAILAGIECASRLALIYPLWFDRPPQALLAVLGHYARLQWSPAGGRKAHVVITMDMPGFAYRPMMRGGQRPLMLDIPGIIAEEPVLIGCASSIAAASRQEWLSAMRDFGGRSHLGMLSPPSRIGELAAAVDRTVSHWWAGL